MQTVLLTDVLDKAIHAGDLVIEDSGHLYLVDDTENSFLRQGYLRVRLARITRSGVTSDVSHTYTQANFCLNLGKPADLKEIPPLDRTARHKLFMERTELSVRRKIDRRLLKE
jgi:hypothetical protein